MKYSSQFCHAQIQKYSFDAATWFEVEIGCQSAVKFHKRKIRIEVYTTSVIQVHQIHALFHKLVDVELYLITKSELSGFAGLAALIWIYLPQYSAFVHPHYDFFAKTDYFV